MHYIDIKVSRKDGSPVPVVSSIIMKGLHHIFSTTRFKGKYALALPVLSSESAQRAEVNPLAVIRVFCREADEMVSLQQEMEDAGINVLATVKAPRKVPEDFTGQYMSFTRFQVRSRGERQVERLKQLQQVEDEKIPYFKVRSNTNKQSFSLMVIPKEKGCPGIWSPNSFGLGSRFALPVLPV